MTGEMSRLLDALGRAEQERMTVCHLAGGTFASVITPVAGAPRLVAEHADRDCWYGTGVLHPRVSTGRGGARDVIGVREVFADLDVKPGGMASTAAAEAVIEDLSAMLGMDPVAVVHSGHGLQPHWAIERDVATDWVDETSPEWVAATALWRRWGRLVAHVAGEHGGAVDNVFDLSRVLRAPGTVNRKGAPVPVTMELTGGGAVALTRLAETLDEYGVETAPEDIERLDDVISDAGTWAFAERTCGYATAMVAGWAGDAPTERHPWLVSQATRLAAAHRAGCLTGADHSAAVAVLAERFRARLRVGSPRAEHRGEITGALAWGIQRVSTFATDRVPRELGEHIHPADARAAAGADGAPGPAQDSERAPGDSYRPVDLGEVVAGVLSGAVTRPVPTVGVRDDGAGLFYPGRVNGLAGPSGSGKGWVALYACVQEIAAGRHVVYLDFEDDPAAIVARLLDAGADPAHVVARFHYVQPDEPAGVTARGHLAAAIAQYAPSLVVIDSTGESMALDGPNPTMTTTLPGGSAPCRRPSPTSAPAVVVIDHVVKSDEGGLWPIGSQRKRAAISGRCSWSPRSRSSRRARPARRSWSAPRTGTAPTAGGWPSAGSPSLRTVTGSHWRCTPPTVTPRRAGSHSGPRP